MATSAVMTEDAVAATAESRFRAQVETLERRLRERDEQRRAVLPIMGELKGANKRPAHQRKAMLQILVDYEPAPRRFAHQTGRLDNSRTAPRPVVRADH